MYGGQPQHRIEHNGHTGGVVVVSDATRKPSGAKHDAPELSARALRYSARAVLWDLTKITRIKDCGRVPVGTAVSVKFGNGSSGFGCLETCGSVWSCPVCAAKIRAERAGEIERVMAAHLATGGTAFFMTMTMRHRRDPATGLHAPLADCWDDLAAGWNAAKSGRTFKQGRSLVDLAPRYAERYAALRAQGVDYLPGAESLRLLGIARFVEATYGENGWHLHVHAILFFSGQQDVVSVGNFARGMFDRWRHTLVERGRLEPIADRGGLDIRPVYGPEGLAQYSTKALCEKDSEAIAALAKGVAREATRADMKHGRRGNRGPWQVIGDFARDGVASDLAVWREWEAASHGRRFVVWSRRNPLDPEWNALLDVRGVELTDEEIAAKDQQGSTLGWIDLAGWRRIRRDCVFLDLLLTAAATGSGDDVRTLLASRDVALLDRPPPQEINSLRHRKKREEKPAPSQ